MTPIQRAIFEHTKRAKAAGGIPRRDDGWPVEKEARIAERAAFFGAYLDAGGAPADLLSLRLPTSREEALAGVFDGEVEDDLEAL